MCNVGTGLESLKRWPQLGQEKRAPADQARVRMLIELGEVAFTSTQGSRYPNCSDAETLSDADAPSLFGYRDPSVLTQCT